MIILLWVGFVVLVLALLALDLGVLNRRPHVISGGEALGWSAFWISLALAFNALVYVMYQQNWLGVGGPSGLDGRTAALQFFTGYLIEKSLSLDNIFVIALVMTWFGVPSANQHRLLFWGVLGALVMRGAMIALGVALIEAFSWITYVFGGLLLLTAVRMLVASHDTIHPDRNPLVRLVRRFYPVTPHYEGARFVTRIDGRLALTPMMLALVVVESTDLLFAIDSIPAIFAVTREPFLIYTSNVFAILGLRSLYFLLAAVMTRFRYLKFSLVFILAYVGVKMLVAHHYPIPTMASLAVIAASLLVGVAASALAGPRDTVPLVSPLPDQPEGLILITYRNARKLVVLIIGSTIMLFGVALLVLPGPGTLAIFLGLAVLASEFVWARRLLKRVKDSSGEVVKSVWGLFGRKRQTPPGPGPDAADQPPEP